MVDVGGQWSCRPSQQEYPLKREIDKEYLKKEDIVSLQQSMGNFDSTFKEVMTFFARNEWKHRYKWWKREKKRKNIETLDFMISISK